MFEAMLRGWHAQQAARGLREDTIAPRERLVRRFGEFTGEYPWQWSPGHMDEWSLHLTAEEHLAPSTIRSYQCTLRQFTEFLVDGTVRLGGGVRGGVRPRAAPGGDLPRVEHDRAPQRLRGRPGGAAVHPRGDAAVPGLRRRAGRAGGERQAEGGSGGLPGRDLVQGHVRLGPAPHRDVEAGPGGLGPQPGGPGVRPVRDAERPLRQGEEGAAAAAAERGLGDGLGGGGGRRLRREHPARGSAAGTTRRCG